jgi:hypothetical protein
MSPVFLLRDICKSSLEKVGTMEKCQLRAMFSVHTSGLHCKLRQFDQSAIIFESISCKFTFPESVEFDNTTYPVSGISDEFLLELIAREIAVPDNITFVISKQFSHLDFSQIHVTHTPDEGWRWRARAGKADSLVPLADPPCRSFLIPNSIEIIESGAFAGSIANVTFSGQSRLREVHGFLCCPFLSVSLPDSVEVVSATAFYACTWMESLSLGSRLRELQCFAAKPEKADHDMCLQSLFVPASVEEIRGICFCPRLELLRFGEPSQLREIFGLNRLAVEELEIPESVEDIDGMSHCPALAKLRFSPSARLRRLKGVGYNESLVEIDIPDSVEELDGFQECAKLQAIRFGPRSRLREVTGLNVLNIAEIRFPESVESLNVLSFCDHLRRVEFGASPRVRSMRGLDRVPCLIEFVIPDSMETVDIMSGAQSLQAVRFGACPRLREFNGFSRTLIVDLTVPDTVDSIVGFNECPRLGVVRFGPNPRVRKLHGFNNSALDILDVPDCVEELVGFDRTDRPGGPRAVNFGAASRLRVLRGFKKTLVDRFAVPALVEELDIKSSYCREISFPERFCALYSEIRCPKRTIVSLPEKALSRVRRWSVLRFAARAVEPGRGHPPPIVAALQKSQP